LSPAFPDPKPRAARAPLLALASTKVGATVFDRMSALPIAKQLEGRLAVSFVDPKRAPDAWTQASAALLTEQQSSPHIARAYAEASRDLVLAIGDRGPDRHWELARRLRVPVLVAHSGRDKVVLPRLRHKWADVLPDSTRVLFTRAGHVPQLSDPDLVAFTWLRFATSLPSWRA